MEEALRITLTVIGVIVIFLIVSKTLRRFLKFPAPAFIGLFLDSALRRWWQPPGKLIERSGTKVGMTVIDLGCGSGAFTTFIARAVGGKGKVYAIDIQPWMLKQLEHKLAKAKNRDITNIEIRKASAYQLPLEDETIDLVYMITVLQEIPDRGRALRETRRVLKPGGILAVTELFSDPDYPFASTTIRMCRKEGFALDKLSGNFWNYTARFKKPMRAGEIES